MIQFKCDLWIEYGESCGAAQHQKAGNANLDADTDTSVSRLTLRLQIQNMLHQKWSLKGVNGIQLIDKADANEAKRGACSNGEAHPSEGNSTDSVLVSYIYVSDYKSLDTDH